MTIYDIASKAAVSISTVSRVLNQAKNVSPKTRERVERVLRESNYAPNDMARGLMQKSMKVVGVLISDVSNLHSAMNAFLIEERFYRWEYNTLLCNSGNDPEKNRRYLQMFARKKVDGLILIGSLYNDKALERTVAQYIPNIPVVVSNGILALPNAYSVLADNEYGMELAITHLMERGHTRIAFVHSLMSYNTQRKIDGFLHVMQKKGLPLNSERNLLYADRSISGGVESAGLLLSAREGYSAVIYSDDMIAVGALNHFLDQGLRVPGDIAVVGHVNSVFSLCARPQLTSVDTKVEAIADVAVNTLHDLLLGKPVGDSIIVRPELVVRGST